jgi:hypothetical protein
MEVEHQTGMPIQIGVVRKRGSHRPPSRVDAPTEGDKNGKQCGKRHVNPALRKHPVRRSITQTFACVEAKDVGN